MISMLDMMVADLDKEITEIETEEKENQSEYEQFMKDSAEKRANDAKSIEDKESAKADLEGTLVSSKEEKAAKTKEAMATAQYLSEVHGDCDWLHTVSRRANCYLRQDDGRAWQDDLGPCWALMGPYELKSSCLGRMV